MASCEDLTPQQQSELNSLIQRVPLTSLSWIIGLFVACGLIAVGGFAFLVMNRPVVPWQKDLVVYVVVICGFAMFCLYAGIQRRQGYQKKIKQMLTRQPIVSWNYTEEDWKKWLEFAEGLGYGRTRNTTPGKVIFMVVFFGLIGGTLLTLTREDTNFVQGFGFCVGLLSLPVLVFYLYWKQLRQDWTHGPSEALIFEKGVFFHHKFVDWEDSPDEGVLVEVETEDQPVATLSIRMRSGNAKLAPHLKDMFIPIPHDQLNEARQLAKTLCQNVNVDEEEA